MFEGIVANILNQCLGRYVQDLDIENLNVGIFSGDVQLVDLKLKPEALYELDLPIEVKAGIVGKANIYIPWTALYTQSVIINVEDVYIIAGPIIDGEYDAEREKRLIRASKRKQLDDLEAENLLGSGPTDSTRFIENLTTTVINNLQIFIRNVHIRYEDTVTNRDCPFACGVCIQNLSVETTNNKWKPAVTPQGATSVYQLIRMESFSIYWNPLCVRNSLVSSFLSPGNSPNNWKNAMRKGLETFSINNEDFDFIVKPITAKVKVIMNKSNEVRVPKLLIDFVLQDAATQLSRQQYLCIISLYESFNRMRIKRKFWRYHPGVPVKNNVSKWWHYAYNSVLEQRVRPYTWQHVQAHREHYRNYKDTFRRTLLSPSDTELKLDLQKLEDRLEVIDIVIAREHAKIELRREDPNRVLVKELNESWWDFWKESREYELHVQANKQRGLLAQLSLAEKKKLYDAIGYVEGEIVLDKPKQYIEHKLNFTLANCSLSLLNYGKEILVITLTQFLTSIETRPSAQAFKISTRAERFFVEGSSLENDLIPVISADNIVTGNNMSNILSFDFEKNPLTLDADFGLSATIEPIEVVYHEHAVSEIINFFQVKSMTFVDVMDYSTEKLQQVAELGKEAVKYAIGRKKSIHVSMDLKGPYVIIPEQGSLQKDGSIIIMDLGQVVIRSDLQTGTVGLEDATQMELEERLYDRFYLEFSDLQLLLCDSGEDWREARKLQDSDYHLVPKIRCQVVFSNSVKPDYRLLPRYKLNVSLANIKLNLSDRRVGMVLDFLHNLPLPSPNHIIVSEVDSDQGAFYLGSSCVPEFQTDNILSEVKCDDLLRIKRCIVCAELQREQAKQDVIDKGLMRMATLDLDKSMLSDHSDEEVEEWARNVDLPGFDDNVSPKNVITMLFRFVIGEVVVHLARSSNRIDKPYLMLRMSKFCCDMALMEYGPAMQAGLGGIQLIDKLHTGTSGEYLELISTEDGIDMVTLLYRKVRADCPDFKSHFHSVEQSLVIDFTSVSIVFHQEAIITLNKFLQYLLQKVHSREKNWKALVPESQTLIDWFWSGKPDPPIPPGATKFSYSTRLGEVKIKLCNTDVDLVEITVGGLESDCLFKANERMVLRVYLTELNVDDLCEFTLYPKILTIEEDKVFDFKYVRHSPKFYGKSDIESKKDDVKSDGSLKFYVGRIHVVLLYKFLIELQHFLEPFIHPGIATHAFRAAEQTVEQQMSMLRGWNTRLHLSIDVHAPMLLLPQKSDSPNLIIINMGDLSVENFFKEITPVHMGYSHSDSAPPLDTPVIDNILVRLESLQMSRAVMTLAGTLEVQEPVLEPVSIRLDIKRAVAQSLNSLPGQYLQHREILLYDVHGGMDNIRINLGQRDLATLLSIWTDNLAEGSCFDLNAWSHPASPFEPSTPTIPSEDTAVKKLQAFFNQSEQVRRETSIRLTMDGLQLYLYSDMDEILSSPVRDLEHALCKLELGEASFSMDIYTDHSLELRMALQFCTVEDTRPDNNLVIRKIFQSHSGQMRMDSSQISVSSPPMVDVTFRQTQSGDCCVDILVEKTRLNLSVPFFISLVHFLLEALPGERPLEGGVVNHGYVGDLGVQQGKTTVEALKAVHRPPSSNDSTSGYFSSGASCTEEQAGLSMSIQLRKPEVMIFSDLSDSSGHALLLRTELLVDYSRHPGRESLVCSLASLQIMSKVQGHLKNPSHLVLQPCDIEFAKSFKSAEEGVKVTASVSPIDIHLSPSTIHTVYGVIEELTSSLPTEDNDQVKVSSFANSDLEDLWSPKKIQPFIYPDLNDNAFYNHPSYPSGKASETFTMAIPKIQIMFEIEDEMQHFPVLLMKSSIETNIHDWTKQMYMKAEFQVQASYFNEKIGTWEPLIEPFIEQENVYRPLEVLVKAFQAKAYPLSSRLDHESVTECDGATTHHRTSLEQKPAESETSGDEADQDSEMTFIRRHNVHSSNSRKGMHESSSFLNYSDDSDSETEEGVLEKLASAFGHLFSGDSSDGEVSESEDSSTGEPSLETEEASDNESISCVSTVIGGEERAVFLKKQDDSVDSGLETEDPDRMATYVMISSRDRLEMTLTPASIKILHDIAMLFTRQSINVQPPADALDALLSLENDIGPEAKVSLLGKLDEMQDTKDKVLMVAEYEKSDSLPSSPASTSVLVDFSPTESEIDLESFEGGFSTSNAINQGGLMAVSPMLSFPDESVTKLYKRITKEKLEIEVQGFDKLLLWMPQRATSKLHMLHPSKNNTRYYLLVDVDIYHLKKRIIVRSPLQIKNETSYAVSLFYKKSVLDALGVEKIGESTNPFEDNVKVAVIEPDQTYNVPLFVAFHCKLHIQPAYTDTYLVSEGSLWWQELAADLNMPKDIYCSHKVEKETTVFSLRAVCVEGVPVNRPTSGTTRLVPNYTIRLLPPLVMYNHLPYALEVKIPSINYESRMEAGEKRCVYLLNMFKVHKIVVEMEYIVEPQANEPEQTTTPVHLSPAGGKEQCGAHLLMTRVEQMERKLHGDFCLKVPLYLGIPWTGSFSLTPDIEEKTVMMGTEYETEGGNKQLGLSIRVERGESCDVFLHAPYWIVNKTGLPLQIRGSSSDVVYEAQGEEPLLFCFKKHRRRCVRLRAYHSSWSSAFSLDAVGSSGLIVCKDRERRRCYRILLKVTLSKLCPRLSKIVTLLPNFLIVNNSRKHLRFMEENEKADLWLDLSPSQCIPFWPDTDSMKMLVKFRDSKLVSQHFPITQVHRTVLRLDKGCGLCVSVTGGGEEPFVITFNNYKLGDAPVRVDNFCEDLFLKIHQEDMGQVALLSPYQSMLYTWDDPAKKRTLLWNVYNRKSQDIEAQFWKDGYGQERVSFHTVKQSNVSTSTSVSSKFTLKKNSPKSPVHDGSSSSDDSESDEAQKPQLIKKTRKDKVTVYWVSYLENQQRVLLFTQDERMAAQARSRIDAEKCNTELFLSLNGVGLSLAVEFHGQYKELAYMSINDGPALWEVLVAHRWKLLTLELASWIEDKWKQDQKKAQMKDYVLVDFEKMQMTKPFYGEIRRTYNPGVWLQYRKSDNLSFFHCKVHRLQIDNQMHDAVFPTVLYPTPVPQHIVKKVGIKPCIELVLMRRHRPAQNQDIYKYVKLLVQEFSIHVDKGFLLSLYDILSGFQTMEDSCAQIRADVDALHVPLSTIAAKSVGEGPQVIIEYMHLSPLKLKFSFSLRGTVHKKKNIPSFRSEVLDFFLNSVGTTLTEVKNVRLKIAYFEQRGNLIQLSQLLDVIWRHYTTQMVQQVHVLVLGLDVLGNPYGLVKDFTKGLGDFFYEPFSSAVEGPEEFSEGLSYGAKSLLGHVVGGATGSISLITGSLGNTISSLSFDEEYKKKRKFCMQQSSDLPETILQAGRTFVLGVALGLSGVIVKPIIGAQQEGVEGFFKGVGKGLMGLITKPTGGVLDSISMAFDGIRRAVEMGEDVVMRVRLPRFMSPYSGVKPFSVYQATGMHLLNTLSRGHYSDSDIYLAHAALSREERSSVILVTSQHVFLLEKCRLWGNWDIEWVIRFDDMMAVPYVAGNKLIFKVRQEDLNIYSGDERCIESQDASVLEWLQKKIEMMMIINMEDKCCPSEV